MAKKISEASRPLSINEASITITGTSDLSFSKMIEERPDQGTWDEWEAKVWRDKFHQDQAGALVLPLMQVKNALVAAAKYRGDKIPGQGNKTYAALFEAAVSFRSGTCPILDQTGRPLVKDDLLSVRLMCSADGSKGGKEGRKVARTFPFIPAGWSASFSLLIFDDRLTREKVALYLETAGIFNGLGRWRPQKGGLNGRFKAVITSWAQAQL